MEHVHHVVGHAFLSHNHLFATVDDEVATLVIPAILAILDSLMLVQILELAEITSEHDRHLTDVDSRILVLKDDSLDFPLALTSLSAIVEVVFEFFLAELDISVELCRVSQVPHAGLVREHRHHSIVRLHDARRVVHMYLLELDLVHNVLV